MNSALYYGTRFITRKDGVVGLDILKNDTSDDEPQKPTAKRRLVKGDEQEARELQKALLESIGTKFAPQVSHVQTVDSLYAYWEESDEDENEETEYAHDDDTTYEYEEEYCSEEEEQEEEQEDGPNSIFEETSSGAWSIVSHTSRICAMMDAAELVRGDNLLGDGS